MPAETTHEPAQPASLPRASLTLPCPRAPPHLPRQLPAASQPRPHGRGPRAVRRRLAAAFFLPAVQGAVLPPWPLLPLVQACGGKQWTFIALFNNNNNNNTLLPADPCCTTRTRWRAGWHVAQALSRATRRAARHRVAVASQPPLHERLPAFERPRQQLVPCPP